MKILLLFAGILLIASVSEATALDTYPPNIETKKVFDDLSTIKYETVVVSEVKFEKAHQNVLYYLSSRLDIAFSNRGSSKYRGYQVPNKVRKPPQCLCFVQLE